MSDAARGPEAKPPLDASEWGLPQHPECPFCAGRETELHSPFGSAASVATYWCAKCHTAFEHIKWVS